MHLCAIYTAMLVLAYLPFNAVLADDASEAPGSEPAGAVIDGEIDGAEDDISEDDSPGLKGARDDEDEDDDTSDIDTETTISQTESKTGLRSNGDLRPIYDYFNIDRRNGGKLIDDTAGFRARIRADFGITETVHVGARLAGSCFTDECDPDFVFDSVPDRNNGLKGGQFTLDELYFHWFRPRGSIAFGRLQTRFVLRSGVYAKSLDRNNSNNVNVNWTDGLQAKYRAKNGWRSSLVIERNSSDGTGSIRHGPLNFDDSKARNTAFVGFENIESWGPFVQRAFDISYLPNSLLEDGLLSTNREDYWGLVGRGAWRWPQRSDGTRLRTGLELGYAPNTQTAQAANLAADADGLAWDIVVSLLDFQPGHSIGVNYARTGAGWLLAPQFRPNEELFEIRYIWRPVNLKIVPLLEARIRWREDLEQELTASQKRQEFDGYIRMTWEFIIKSR
jgi:hypothetical protein